MAELSGAMDTGRGATVGSSVGSLDEPVSETIMRDLNKIYIKLRVVLRPQSNQEETLRELRQWDLWGPLLLCLLLSIVLSTGAPAGQEMLLFSSVFFIFWVGSAVVTFNAQLLGGKISFFQSVCVLGYCMFPLNIGSVLCYLSFRNITCKILQFLPGIVTPALDRQQSPTYKRDECNTNHCHHKSDCCKIEESKPSH